MFIRCWTDRFGWRGAARIRSMELEQVGKDAQVPDDLTLIRVAGTRCGVHPVDTKPVSHRFGQPRQATVIGSHG
jgi:hypothetical protein